MSSKICALQERITTTLMGSITNVQAMCIHVDGLTDPVPAATFAHLDVVVSSAVEREDFVRALRHVRWLSRQRQEVNVGNGSNHRTQHVNTIRIEWGFDEDLPVTTEGGSVGCVDSQV